MIYIRASFTFGLVLIISFKCDFQSVVLFFTKSERFTFFKISNNSLSVYDTEISPPISQEFPFSAEFHIKEK
jgi:hypothetical protein